ncbi:Na(+)/H(+) exchange regulatory cofactor NHE-RF1-like isoform X1 [Anguilla anguilla]|uniref:Na(+)/H(+) exchange regulatory cofactor NHE-RF1-like isoform X1 n=1 Tax=Anguilla anguilla TaxID=7936 RepID=UPI0015AA0B5B|nr:Na(+)/H(+) exchange regulatory cofactor NHE-RF1-like isoform X1 [Anguilla anguilla]
MSFNREHIRPRLCVLEKGSDGYGFHLHGEKGKTGQFIRLVEPDSPSESAGLHAGDRLLFVNGECVENDSHQQLVSRIRATVGKLELVVVDEDTEELLKKCNMQYLREYATQGIPLPTREPNHADAGRNGSARELTPTPEINGPVAGKKRNSRPAQGFKSELRPRLCVLKRGAEGYGFNLHSDSSRPGQYIRLVDPDSPAQRSGLRPKDKIVQVNGVPVGRKQHSEVVSAIKAGGDRVSLLVVDPETDAFFQSCGISPTEEHLTGALPVIREVEEEVNVNGSKEEAKEPSLSVSLSPSSTSNISEASEESVGEYSLDLSLSLQQAKERAHQNRSSKRAPQMDWSKKNELFSNL